MHVTGVKALKNPKTGAIRVYPFEVAKAEVRQIAERFGLLPRDVGSLLMILAKPGYFQEGDVLYKYHLQKSLFYLWKSLDAHGYSESLPIDIFVAADNGPVPKHLNKDLQRFEKHNLIKTKYEKWEQGKSKRITLTREGMKLAQELWCVLPDPYKEIAIKVKERIYPLSPDRVRRLVHREYPQYKNTYVKNDIE